MYLISSTSLAQAEITELFFMFLSRYYWINKAKENFATFVLKTIYTDRLKTGQTIEIGLTPNAGLGKKILFIFPARSYFVYSIYVSVILKNNCI